MTGELAMLAALGLPLLAAALVPVIGERSPNLREGQAMVIASATFGCVIQVLLYVQAGFRLDVELFELLPGLSLAFHAEPLGVLFAMVASGLWIVTTLYAAGYMRGHHETNQTRFFTCFAIAIFGALGVAFARNLFTLFIFYEVLTLSTYPLVTHHRDAKAKAAGRLYLGVLFTTSIGGLLLATIWTWQVAGTLEFVEGGVLAGKMTPSLLPLLLALFVFGTGKAAVMPFHRWLPAAMVAPTPVSALLHAVAVVKAGVFTVLKVTVYIFGLDLLAETGASMGMAYVAAVTVVTASCIALTKDNLKARLAYSTISQLGYIVLGAMIATPASILGGGMHIAMHAVGKITLFFCAGAIYVGAHKTEISSMDGLGRAMPLTYGAFFIGSLTIIGIPPAGALSIKLSLMEIPPEHWPLLATYMVSPLLAIGYLMPVVARGFFLEPAHAGGGPGHAEDSGHSVSQSGSHGPGHAEDSGHSASPSGGWLAKEAPVACVVPLCITAAGCLALFVVGWPMVDLLTPITR